MATLELSEKKRAALDELQRRRETLTPRQQSALDEILRRAGTNLRPVEPSLRATGSPEPEAPQSTAGMLGETAMGMAETFGQGVTEGAANIAGLPADAVRGAINIGLRQLGIPEIDPAFFGTEAVQRGAESLFPRREPETGLERIAERTGQEVGETLASLGPVMKIVHNVVKGAKGVQAVQAARSVPQAIIQDLAKIDPGKLAAVETALAGSAGATAGALREIFPEGGAGLDLLGEIIGGFGPGVALGLVRKARQLGGRLVGSITREEAERGVGKELARATASEERLERGVEEAERLSEEIPGFQPTLGQATGDPGLVTKERAFERSTSKQAGQFARRRQESQTAVRDALEEEAPIGRQEDAVTGLEASKAYREDALNKGLSRAQAKVDAAKGRVSQRTQRMLADTETRFQKAEQRAQVRLDTLRPTITEGQAGRIIRQEYLAELQTFREQAGRFYDAIPGDLMLLGSQELKGRVARLREFNPVTQRAQDFPVDLVERIEALPGAVTFTELRELRSTIKDTIRDARAGATPNDRLAMRSSELLDEVERHISEQMGTLYPDEFPKFQEANEFYQKGVARLKQGTAARLRRKDRTGRFETPDEEAAFLFLEGETPVNDYVQAIGSRPEAQRALQETMKLDFFEKAVPDGRTVNPQLAARWIANHKEALTQFPELRQQFGNASVAQEHVNAMRKQAEAIQQNPEQHARILGGREFGELDAAERKLAKVTETVTRTRKQMEKSSAELFLGEDADRAATRILSSGTPVARYAQAEKALAGNPTAKRGLQRALWDAMLDKFESRAVDGLNRPVLQARAMRDFLDKNKALIVRVFGQDRWAGLQRVQKAMEMIETTGRVVQPGGSDTAVNLGTLIRDAGPLLSRLYAHQRGIISLKWILSERLARNLANWLQAYSKEQVDALFEEAFFDPKVAQTLILAAQGGSRPLITKRLNAHLANMNQSREDEP